MDEVKRKIPAGQSGWHLPSYYERITSESVTALRHREENEMPSPDRYATWPRRPKPYAIPENVKEPKKVLTAPAHLMTPQEVKDRLAAGEDPLLLSLEHWVQNAAWIKEHGSLPSESMKDDTCALCSVYRVKSCRECPLGISQGGSCDGGGSNTAWRRIWRDPTYDNAMNMVAVLASLKPVEPKSHSSTLMARGRVR